MMHCILIERSAMLAGELAFLVMVILAFTLFGVTMAWANWFVRSWAVRQPMKTHQSDDIHQDRNWRQAA
jgi:hypothetical protein